MAKLMSVYWWAIIVFVAAAISYMASAYYGGAYDVREIETNLLLGKVADCFSYNGYLTDTVYKDGNFIINEENFLDICGLSLKDVDGAEDQYFLNVSIFPFVEGGVRGELQKQFIFGAGHFVDLCFDGDDRELLPFCERRSFYVSDKNKKGFYVVDVLAVVGKVDQND